MTRVLVVDDECKTAEILKAYLTDGGFAVTVSHDGGDALTLALEGAHDAVILDINLPTLSGIEILKRIREVSPDLPVIFVSARTETADRVVGLELGASDYVTKPFDPREVVARLRNALRRVGNNQPAARREHDVTAVDGLEIDRRTRRVLRDGEPVYLTATEFRILEVFSRHVGVALSRAQLIELIRGSPDETYDRTLDKHVANLRRKIEARPGEPRYIVTVPGIGYKLRAR